MNQGKLHIKAFLDCSFVIRLTGFFNSHFSLHQLLDTRESDTCIKSSVHSDPLVNSQTLYMLGTKMKS